MARKPSSKVNLAAIAQDLKMSISTVSRALRDAEGIHPDTRVQVIAAAERLGYDMKRRKSARMEMHPHHIMALAQSSSFSTDQRFLAGMSRASVTLNLAILSHHVSLEECANIFDPKHQPAAMRAGQVEGLILIHRFPHEVAAQLSEKWPTVSIIHYYEDTKIDLIGTDDRSGVLALVRHLRAGGHERIGFFGLCPQMSWASSRFAAYVEALVKVGLPYLPDNVVEISLENALSPEIFERNGWTDRVISRTKAGVDAWVCSSAGVAETLCRCFLDHGLRVPQDVALVGYHKRTPMSSNMPVLTTTVVIDEDLGAAALRRLIHRFEYPDESQRTILVPAKLSVGETTRPVVQA